MPAKSEYVYFRNCRSTRRWTFLCYQQKLKERHEDYYLLLLLILEIEKKEERKKKKRGKVIRLCITCMMGENSRSSDPCRMQFLVVPISIRAPLPWLSVRTGPYCSGTWKTQIPQNWWALLRHPDKHRPHKTGEHCSGTWTNTDPIKLMSTAQAPEETSYLPLSPHSWNCGSVWVNKNKCHHTVLKKKSVFLKPFLMKWDWRMLSITNT